MGARKVVLEKAGLVTKTLNEFHETVRQQSDSRIKLEVGIERVNQIAVELAEAFWRLMMRI